MANHPAATQARVLGEDFEGFSRFIKDSHRWLERIKKKSIFWQLEDRKIGALTMWPMLSTAALGIDENVKKLHVYFNDYSKLEYAFGCLGHEIAHTFGLNFKKDSITKTFDQHSDKFHFNPDEYGPTIFFIEDLCNAFARKWVSINTKEKIKKDCQERNNMLSAFILFISDAREKEYTL